MTLSARPMVFVWEHFGPQHLDRCAAVAEAMSPAWRVVGLELSAKSADYDWESGTRPEFEKILLDCRSRFQTIIRVASATLRLRAKDVFLCHYERPSVWAAAMILRLLGVRCHMMIDSKFDDRPRTLRKEGLKRLFLLPYFGALCGSPRTAAYVSFLTNGRIRTALGYNGISRARFRALASSSELDWSERPFLVVARLIPKKNLTCALSAYSIYRHNGGKRRLIFCGSGPEEQTLKDLCARLDLAADVDFVGFVPAAATASFMADALALLLVSVEEQFGQVIAEAQFVALPVICTAVAGACDELVRSGVNGFIVEPDNPEGMAWMMSRLGGERALWDSFSTNTEVFAHRADVSRFVDGVRLLAEPRAGADA